jgi:hypothetical protein
VAAPAVLPGVARVSSIRACIEPRVLRPADDGRAPGARCRP